MLQFGLAFSCCATLFKTAFAVELKVKLPLLNCTLGNEPSSHVLVARFFKLSRSSAQQGGSGHLPIPSASTGKQSRAVRGSLSLQSGTPSPSVSRLTPWLSTGQPEGVFGSISN